MNAAAQTSLKPLIHFEQVTKSFKGRVVLKDLSIDLQVGQCHLLLGDNGAGKSTLLRILAGLLKPDNAVIEVDRDGVSWRKQRNVLRSKIMYLHQAPYLFDGSVQKNLEYALPKYLSRREQQANLRSVMEWGGLQSLADNPAKQLSGGEKQRLALARARLRQPEIMLLDEPTANLDYKAREQTVDLLKSLKSSGVSLLIACHDHHELDTLADGVYRLESGALKHTMS